MILRMNGVAEVVRTVTTTTTSATITHGEANSLLSSLLAHIDPVVEQTQESGGWLSNFWSDHVTEPTKDYAQDKFMDYIVIPVAHWFVNLGKSIFDFLLVNSVTIIEAGVIICAIGVMIAPLAGKQPGYWVGKGTLVLIAGALWRILT